MTNVSVYEQECFGKIQYRVMRDDGLLIFERIQTDFSSEEDAVSAIHGEFRRKILGPAKIRLHRRGWQANGRDNSIKEIIVNQPN